MGFIPPTSHRPAGRRERRKIVTRADLIAAGRELFSAKGLHESRVEEITGRAGIAKGTLYRYFPSKESLIRAVVAEGFEKLGRSVEARTRGARGLEEVIARMVESHYEFFARNPELMRLFQQIRGMLRLHRGEWRSVRGLLAAHVERMAGMLERLAPGETASARRRSELAGLVFGAISGALSVRVALDPRGELGSLPPGLTRSFIAMARAYRPSREASRRGRKP